MCVCVQNLLSLPPCPVSIMNKDSNLQSILNRFLVQISSGRSIVLATTEGAELMCVHKTEEQIANNELTNNCSKALEQTAKYGLGSPKYSISWGDIGILVQFRLDSLSVSLTMDDTANLGLLDDHLSSLQRILKPFSSSNFINHSHHS